MNECNVVKDLLPLYAEELTSPDSGELIRAHMARCADCRDLWRRYKEELPMTQQMELKQTAAQVKKAVWRDRLYILGFVLVCLLLTVVLTVGYGYYYWWEDGAFSVVKTFEAPNGQRSIKLADLSTAGFFQTEGNQLRFYFEDGINRYRTDWKDVEVHWAPDSKTSFFVIENAEGEEELRIVDQKENHGGGTWNIPGLIPAEGEPDLNYVLAELCAACPGFPEGWENITFSFVSWGSDSETVTLEYVTDNGQTGTLDYHYPTETITKLYE